MGPKKSKQPETNSYLQVRNYQKRIAASLEKDRQLAKQLIKEGKTDRAKLLLRKKKYMESLLDQTDNQLDQLGKTRLPMLLFVLLIAVKSLLTPLLKIEWYI